jgi:cytochrome c-type biogenesis protein CcmF
MITEFGAYALVLALVLSALQLMLSAIGGARRSSLLAGAGRGAALGAFLCTA